MSVISPERPATQPPPMTKPLYRQPRAWGELVLITLVCAMAAMLVLMMSSLGTAHNQTAAANSSLGTSRASNASLRGQLASSQAQLAAQQGRELVGTWKLTGANSGTTYVFNANHTATLTGSGGTWSGYWAVATPNRLVLDDQGLGPTLPSSEGGGPSDMGFAPAFVINGNNMTWTYGSGSDTAIEVYTRP